MKKIKYLAILSSIAIGLVGCGKITKEEVIQSLDDHNYKNFAKDYEKLTEDDKKIVDNKLEEKLKYIVEEFTNTDLSKENLDICIDKINLLKVETNEYLIDEVIAKLNELYSVSQESIVAYENGIKFMNEKEYEKSLEEFNKVSVNHPIYSEVKKNIELVNKELEKIKPAPVEVVNVRLSRDIIDNQVANIQIENKSDKVIKEVHFSVFGYDNNGYPVKVQFNTDDYLNCKLDHTLQPGEKSKSDWGWNLYNKSAEITQLKVSIERVDFYEGEAWENPMYNSDVDKYAGKPIK